VAAMRVKSPFSQRAWLGLTAVYVGWFMVLASFA
jgi:hypothetical protein